MSHSRAQHLSPKAYAALAVGAIGVVFGDIGTSPLYALKESFAHLKQHGESLDELYIRGILSIVFWLLFVVVNIKTSSWSPAPRTGARAASSRFCR